MRAAIACTKCRRSKTKCNNKGNGTACETCVANKHPCEYQDAHTTATGSGGYQRRESTAGDVDAPPKKRKRPLASATHYPSENARSQADVLDEPWLTTQVWKDLFDIYEKHFATEFPFLHRARFMRPLNQARTVDPAATRKEHWSNPRPPYGPLLLYAFLTQTARYHPDIVSRMGGTPIMAAELFAEATRKQLRERPDAASLENTQALLFLGFYEWADLQGQKGFITLRAAITNAQALGYQHVDDPRKKIGMAKHGDEIAQEEHVIDREIERRTFWSCFIMDRYASCGKTRPPVLVVADTWVQLPCSDKAFNDGQKVKTRFLGESDESYAKRRQQSASLPNHSNMPVNVARYDQQNVDPKDEEEWEFGKDEGVLSLYIQAVDHFGKVMKWSTPGGRRIEVLPPWDSGSGFKELEDNNKRLRAALPKGLILTTRNTEHHIAFGTSRNYLLIHAMHTLCTIALYREYMAFSPFSVDVPKGPLDEPRITATPPVENYWVHQASQCFGAAREFADLLRACHQANALVDTPIAGFATYIVAWSACYCFFFPRMDPEHALDVHLQPNAWDISNTIIRDMTSRLRMAHQWIEFLSSLRRYYLSKKIEWKEAGGSPRSTTSDNAGGLNDYSEQFETSHKEFGSLVNGPASFEKVNPDEMKLQPDPDERSEAPSSVIYKSESTPAQTPKFTSVNPSVHRSSVEETISEASMPPHQSSATHSSNMSSGIGSSQASLPPYQPYSASKAYALEPSAQGVSVTTSAYYSVPNAHLPQNNHNLYHTQDITPGSEPVHYASQPWWPQQPQPRFNQQQIRTLELGGEYSLDMSDLASMQSADNRIGEPDYHFGAFHENCWTQQVSEVQHAPPGNWPSAPHGSGYSNMDAK